MIPLTVVMKTSRMNSTMLSVLTMLLLVKIRCSAEYGWETGPWSGCSAHQSTAFCGSTGIETRTVNCVHLPTGEPADDHKCWQQQPAAVHDASGPDRFVGGRTRHLQQQPKQHRPAPLASRECFRTCPHHRHAYQWSVGPWSDCRATGVCMYGQQPGIQRRNVTCRAVCDKRNSELPAIDSTFSTSVSSDACVYFSPEPETERPCIVHCRRDCVATEFGPEMGNCESCWSSRRIRHRWILLPAQGGGRDCTGLVKEESCPPRDECKAFRHTNYRYRIGPWSTCTVFHHSQQMTGSLVSTGSDGGGLVGSGRSGGFTSVIGQRRRTVDCIDVNGSPVERSFCSHHKKPPSLSLCILSQPVTTTKASAMPDQGGVDEQNSSKWTSFSDSLFAFQARNSPSTLSHAGGGQGQTNDIAIAVDMNAKRRAAIGVSDVVDPGVCDSYKWLVGEWSQCQLQQPSDGCGSGIQNRTVLCVSIEGLMPSPDWKCVGAGEPDHHTRTCQVPCPVPCAVSEWSSWSDCLPEKCRAERTKSKDGYRWRSRSLLRNGSYDDMACPHLHESQPCEYPLCYTWKVTSHAECQLQYNDMQCGEGNRNRTSECVSISGGTVSSRFCNDPKPVPVEVCKVPCANACVTSEWSEWSSCSRTCSYGRFVGHRTRFRDILANAGLDGTPCPPVRMLIEKERCAEVPCYAYYWLPGPWGQCQQSTENHLQRHHQSEAGVESGRAGQRCGPGSQERELHCYKTTGEKVTSKRCMNEVAPPTVRDCTIPCPVNCVVSAFTEWSSCSVTCISEPCPELHETRPCMNLVRCRTYRWQPSEWSQCMFHSHQEKCGVGFRAREVRCVSDRDDYVVDSMCLAQRGIAPKQTQPCRVPCDQDQCKFSDWTEWNACNRRCGGFQTRSRSMEGTTSRLAECYDRVKYPVEDQRACACPARTVKLIGIWSHCRLDASMTPADVDLVERSIGQLRPGRGYCGVGRRSHALVCSGSDGQNVSALACATSDFMEEMCFVPCPRDCQLSQWTSWSPCYTDGRCGNGFQTRSRYVIEPNLDGGRDCPSLTDGEEHQRIPCHVTCDQYQWRAEDWSVCSLINPPSVSGPQCGEGIQSRVVRCVRETPDGDEDAEVDESKCDKLLRPFDNNYCHLPCPGQCVVTSWSAWSNCTQGCDESTRRRRYRQVVRYPARISRADTGSVPIQSGPLYSPSETSGFSASSATDLEAVFGFVGEDIAASEENPPPSALIKLANVPIDSDPLRPIDAVSGAESPSGRAHSRVGASLAGGSTLSGASVSSCPHLEEFERCDSVVLSCRSYTWHWTAWGPCQLLVYDLDGGSVAAALPGLSGTTEAGQLLASSGHRVSAVCGPGRRVRYAECRRSDGDVVAEEFCLSHHGPLTAPTEDSCHVPCPVDCVVSDWASWSECSVSCGLGLQTRLRAVVIPSQHGGRHCPDPLNQIRHCAFTECFQWQTSEWQPCHIEAGGCGYGTQSRNLTCLRHDGVVVDSAFCSVAALDQIPLTQPCVISCPQDCVVSEWSEWGPCHRPCELRYATSIRGTQTRSRIILVPAGSSNGVPCPDDVIQTRSCPNEGYCPTYEWHAVYWSARGGTGNARHVTCQRSDGLVVDGACHEAHRPAEAAVQGSCPSYCAAIEFAVCHDGACVCRRGYDDGIYVNGKLDQCRPHIFYNKEQDEASLNITWLYVLCATTIVAVVTCVLVFSLCRRRAAGIRTSKHPPTSLAQTDVTVPLPINCSHKCNPAAVPGATVVESDSFLIGQDDFYDSIPRHPLNNVCCDHVTCEKHAAVMTNGLEQSTLLCQQQQQHRPSNQQMIDDYHLYRQ